MGKRENTRYKDPDHRRPSAWMFPVSRVTKTLTHRTERLQGERELRRELSQREPNVREEGLQWARMTYWDAALFDPECEEERYWQEFQFMHDPLYDLEQDYLHSVDYSFLEQRIMRSPWKSSDEDARTMYGCDRYEAPYRREGYD